MWNCQHCGAAVQDDQATCWNCQRGQDDSPEAAAMPGQAAEDRGAIPAVPPPICLRCGTAMDFRAVASITPAGDQSFGNQGFEIFVCARCGHAEFFDGQIRRAGAAGQGST